MGENLSTKKDCDLGTVEACWKMDEQTKQYVESLLRSSHWR